MIIVIYNNVMMIIVIYNNMMILAKYNNVMIIIKYNIKILEYILICEKIYEIKKLKY